MCNSQQYKKNVQEYEVHEQLCKTSTPIAADNNNHNKQIIGRYNNHICENKSTLIIVTVILNLSSLSQKVVAVKPYSGEQPQLPYLFHNTKTKKMHRRPTAYFPTENRLVEHLGQMNSPGQKRALNTIGEMTE